MHIQEGEHRVPSSQGKMVPRKNCGVERKTFVMAEACSADGSFWYYRSLSLRLTKDGQSFAPFEDEGTKFSFLLLSSLLLSFFSIISSVLAGFSVIL